MKQKPSIPYTDLEKEIILKTYKKNTNSKSGWLDDLSKQLNRPKTNISRYARQQGLTSRKRKMEMISCKCIVCKKTFQKEKYNRKVCCSVKCGQVISSGKLRGQHTWANREHPKGMLGKKHSKKYCKKISERVKKAWSDKESVYNSKQFKERQSEQMHKIMSDRVKNNPSSIYSNCKKEWYEHDNKKYYMRSGWELNYACYLDFLIKQKEIKKWEYEPDTFWFEKIRRGVRSYLPDFKIFNNNGSIEYHEVKGWMDTKSKTKLKRMAKYYPEVKMILIDEKPYKAIMKYKKLYGANY